ncbi:hypothetical protein CONCODRAFT_79670 [Conidiobolus coronatus NRRL 28638]|uniref:Uncharacterized protein n=1 Tax=Conidiobolus coronatus (strain ATCC 28846 / CBS 209.66 / NRRL 28638) TaxID=796925 RepID=A0A137P109_CONC2|nr:hypothetical protein CONCODRAFT_79670 [Conidiobolus coronatus NRRL 28638]|eukprot:KXN68737.1 hypothetical protein CONCODRAFT_79670 [Conidiobolus coronatus NRRL 28638]
MELYIQLAFASLLFHLQLIWFQFPALKTLADFSDSLLNSRLLFQLFTPTLIYLAITDNLFYPLSFLVISLSTWSTIIYLDSALNYNLIFEKLEFNEEFYSFQGVPLVLVFGLTLINLISLLVTNVLFGGVGGLPEYVEVKVDLLNLPEVEVNKDENNINNNNNNNNNSGKSDKSEKDTKSSKPKGKGKKSGKENKQKKAEDKASTSTQDSSQEPSSELEKSEIIEIQSLPNISQFHQSLTRLKLSLVDSLISVYILLTYDAIFKPFKLYTYLSSSTSITSLSPKIFELGFLQLLVFYLYRQLESTALRKLTFYFKTENQFLSHLVYLEVLPILLYALELIFIFGNIRQFKLDLKLMYQVALPFIGLLVKFSYNIRVRRNLFNNKESNITE